MNKADRFKLKINMLSSFGYQLRQGDNILDLGCGAGDLVWVMREQGYQSFGCDVSFKKGPHVENLVESGFLRTISPPEYLLPFEDASFDLVTSDQVFEHIQDHKKALLEINRVLKPGGISLHIYPPPAILIEPHVFVPFAGLIQSRSWLKLWSLLGVRTKAQVGMSREQVAQQNFEYLNSKTNYISKTDMETLIKQVGLNFSYGEAGMLSFYNSKTKRFMSVNRVIPIFPWLCRFFVSRVLLLTKPTQG